MRELTENDTEIIQTLLDFSKTFYPEQYKALNEVYANSSLNKRYFDFLRARRIVGCCFGESDRRADIDHTGGFNFEFVKCPLMAECKHYKIICQPKFDSSLSERELEVMRMYFDHIPTGVIAEKLFISIHTVNNHRKNVLMKLNLHSIDEFITYAYKNKLFEV
jgi:DNA-binding CsgD family transcriptional regulator